MPKKRKSRIVLLTICLLAVLFACGCSAGQELPSKENLPAPEPPESATRNSYDIQLALDTDAKTINGSVKVKVTNTSQDTWSQLCFRDYISAIGQTFDEMSGSHSGLTSEFSKIHDLSSKETLKYSRAEEDRSVLFVKLDSPLAPGKSTELQFDYKASIPENAFRYRYTAEKGGKDLLFELANFYPILSVYENGEWQHDPFYYEGECFYSQCADYSIALTLPEGYTVVSSGTEKKGSPENGLCVWTIEAKNMRDVGITASNDFAFTKSSFGDIPVRCYYFDNAAAKKQAELMLETAVDSLKFYTQNIGGYPYQSLDVVMTNDMIGAIEFPAYVRIGDYSSQMDSDGDYITNLIIENTAHEVAHQWFYAVVGNNCYQEPWLDESFASFCQFAYQAENASQKELEELVRQGKSSLQASSEVYLDSPYDKLGKNYLSAVYEKGKFFLYDLMNAMGKEEFYDMLQEYYRTNAFQEIHTEDFINMVYKYADQDEVQELIKANLRH